MGLTHSSFTDDIQLPQFMVTNDGRLKLGDFNRAEFMLYDEEHGEYCKYRNGHGHGDVSGVDRLSFWLTLAQYLTFLV